MLGILHRTTVRKEIMVIGFSVVFMREKGSALLIDSIVRLYVYTLLRRSFHLMSHALDFPGAGPVFSSLREKSQTLTYAEHLVTWTVNFCEPLNCDLSV